MRQARIRMMLVVLGLVLSQGATLRADPITVDGGWSTFSWQGGVGAFNEQGPFTFFTTAPVTVSLTDAWIVGDRFAVYDLGVLAGVTSTPLNDGSNLTSDPDTAFADSRYSHGTFLLLPGSHSLAIQTTEMATGQPDGGAFLRVDTSVNSLPEPTSLTLAALGIAGLAWRCRRRSQGERAVS